jgi:hypothetical protein
MDTTKVAAPDEFSRQRAALGLGFWREVVV